MDAKRKYFLVLDAMAAISSPYAREAREKINFSLDGRMTEILGLVKNQFQESGELNEEQLQVVNQYKMLLEAIPNESAETRKVANQKINEALKKLEAESLYDPKVFYQIYFFMNVANQTEMYETPFYRVPLIQENFANQFMNGSGSGNDNFYAWFANSQVTETSTAMQKRPMMVYHGTGADEFTEFNFDRFPVSYFAENKDYSEWFQKARGGEGAMFTCYLKVQNPIDLRLFGVRKVTYDEFVGYVELKYGYKLPFNKMLKAASDQNDGLWAWQYIRGGVEWLKLIRDTGYFDGFKYYENNPDDMKNGKENVTPAWAVFNANQIKSARGNFTFSSESKDIRFKKGGNLEH